MNLKNLFYYPATFVPRDEGDPFIVIARHQPEIVLGLRLTLGIFKSIEKSKWAAVFGVLSARQHDEPMPPTAARETFGGLHFKLLDGECISESVWPLVAIPCSPAEMSKVYTQMRADLARNYVTQLKERLAISGSTLCMSDSLMEIMILTRLEYLMPEMTATCNDDPSFLFLSESGRPAR